MLYMRHAVRSGHLFLLWAAAAALMIGTAGRASSAASLAPNPGPVAIPVTTIEKGNFSGIVQPLEAVVRTPTEWEKLWNRHVSIQTPRTALPQIDFAKEMVVAIFLGQKNTGGYELTITRAERTGSAVEVFYHIETPKTGAFTIQAITDPFHIVTLPRNDGPVRFVRSS